MNIKSLPIVALLLVSSAAAFGLGWVLKPAPPVAENSLGIAVPDVASLTPEQRTRAEGSAKGNRAASPISQYLPVSGAMSSENIASAVQAMSRENDPLKKSAMLTALLDQLTPENAKAAFTAMREAESGRRGRGRGGDEMRLLLNAWGRIDGDSAIAEVTAIAEQERAEREADGGGRGRGGWGRGDGGSVFDIHSILSGWAMNDSSAALEYVNSLEGDDRRKDMYTNGIVRGLMANGVDEAVDFIASLPADSNRGRHMASVAEEILQQGVGTASQWATSLQDDDLKSGAMDRVASEYARQDLDAAVAWISKHSSEDYASRAVTEIAEEWAEKDPQAVIDWAGNLPSDTQKEVFQEAFNEWTERDPLAASQHLSQMPQSEVKDSAVEGFARELARENPEAAATWAGTIGNEEVRASTLVDVARDWLRSDREAAEAWLPQSGLSPEAQQSVLESRRGGRRDWGRRR